HGNGLPRDRAGIRSSPVRNLKEEIMRFRNLARGGWALTTVALLALSASPASAQLFGHPRCCPSDAPPCCPSPVPATPTMPTTPPTPTTPSTTTDQTTTTPTTEPEAAPSLPTLAQGSQGGRGVAFGSYIDSALVRTQLRLRFDAAYNDNRPDRAELF